MESLSKHSAVTQRNPRYLVACLVVGFVSSSLLACKSDDSDKKQSSSAESKNSESQNSAKDNDSGAGAAGSDSSKGKDEASVEVFHPMASAEQEAASKEQMRYDGTWKGTTNQKKPVMFKILSRFLGHIEITYALEGDGCKFDDKAVKVSVMNGVRGTGFSAMNTSDTEKMTTTGMFTADDKATGTFMIEAVGDVPKGCNKMLSGTWEATK